MLPTTVSISQTERSNSMRRGNFTPALDKGYVTWPLTLSFYSILPVTDPGGRYIDYVAWPRTSFVGGAEILSNCIFTDTQSLPRAPRFTSDQILSSYKTCLSITGKEEWEILRPSGRDPGVSQRDCLC